MMKYKYNMFKLNNVTYDIVCVIQDIQILSFCYNFIMVSFAQICPDLCSLVSVARAKQDIKIFVLVTFVHFVIFFLGI